MKLEINGARKATVFTTITSQEDDVYTMYQFEYEHSNPGSRGYHSGSRPDIESLINTLADGLKQSAEVVTLDSPEKGVSGGFKIPIPKDDLSYIISEYRQRRRTLIANID